MLADVMKKMSPSEPYGSKADANANGDIDLEDPTRGRPGRENDSVVYGYPSKPPSTLHRVSSRVLPHVPLFLAFLFGIALTAGTTYALVVHVRHIVGTASVDPDPAVWTQQARTRAYDRCYNGCSGPDDSDCAADPEFVANACARTAEAGTACDAARMWNWREDRYPDECLVAVGEIYRDKALAAKRRKRKGQYGLVVLTVLGGLIVGWVTYKLGQRVVARWQATRRQPPSTVRRGTTWAQRQRQRRSEKESNITARPARLKVAIASFLALFGSRAQAYACSGYGAAVYQYFVNENRTIAGVVEGWMSNCYDYQVCNEVCTTSCSSTSSGSTSCTTSCLESCTTYTHVDKKPKFYVSQAAGKVLDCGFEFSDTIQQDVGFRVANAGIEKNYWVKISVNGYNVTSPGATDDEIWCLHRIGDTKP